MHRSARGLTLVELIIVVAILATLSIAALPIARYQTKRVKERQLREDLWSIRDAIDRYKFVADNGGFMIKVDSFGYPPDLDTLTHDVNVNGKKIHFLPRMPVDPMTGKADWCLRSMQDEPDSDSWGGQNVFDVYSNSKSTALNGTKYSDW
jgi:general secretion pathway protein G